MCPFFFYLGISKSVDLGVEFPPGNFEKVRDVNLISEQEYQDISARVSKF